MLIKNGTVLEWDKGFSRRSILTGGGKIIETGLAEGTDEGGCIDAEGLYVLPGFIDIHTHGAAGVDVNSASTEDICKRQVWNFLRNTRRPQAGGLNISQFHQK
jgi:N-acetylglucosamine-6-phosphate deacetylase